MFDDESELKLYEDFLLLGREHPQSKAVHYIRELWEHKGVPISSTRLYTLYQPNFQVYLDDDLKQLMRVMHCLHQSEFPELSIPALDGRAVKEIGDFIRCVRCDLAEARENNDLARIDDNSALLEQINRCVLDCFLPNGDVRCLGGITRDHARLIYQGIDYFKKCIYPIHPKLAEHIHAHAVIGNDCYWSLNPLHLRA